MEDVFARAQIPGNAWVPYVMEGISVHRAWTTERAPSGKEALSQLIVCGRHRGVVVARTRCTRLPDRSRVRAALPCQRMEGERNIEFWNRDYSV